MTTPSLEKSGLFFVLIYTTVTTMSLIWSQYAEFSNQMSLLWAIILLILLLLAVGGIAWAVLYMKHRKIPSENNDHEIDQEKKEEVEITDSSSDSDGTKTNSTIHDDLHWSAKEIPDH